MSHILSLPHLDSLFPSLLHPAVEAIEADTLRWCHQFNLLSDESLFKKFKQAKFGWLTARVHPRVSFESACLASYGIVWLFLNDDWTDEMTPEQMRPYTDQLFDIMKNADTPVIEEEPTASALRDLWKRIQATAYPPCQQRYKKGLLDYLDATVWEAGNRRLKQIADLETYKKMRPLAGAMHPVIDMIEIVEGICLPDEVLRHEAVARLTDACCNLVGWSNDIVSLRKEMQQGDVHNLVLVLQREHMIPLEKANELAAEMYNEELYLFAKLGRQLPSFGPEDEPLRRYVDGLRDWIQGNFDWFSQDTQRYKTFDYEPGT